MERYSINTDYLTSSHKDNEGSIDEYLPNGTEKCLQ